MRLSTSTAILHHHFDYALTLTDIPAVIRTAGFDALDWSTWQFCLQGGKVFAGLLNDDAWEAQINALREADERAGIVCRQTHCVSTNYARYQTLDAEHLRLLEQRCIRTAAILGAEWTVIHPFAPEGAAREESIRYFCEYLKPLEELAGKLGVGIAIENMPDITQKRFCCKAEELCALVDAFNNPLVGCCWDTGHGMVSGDDQYEALTLLGHRVKALHIDDNYGTARDVHLLPYEGLIDWSKVLRALRELVSPTLTDERLEQIGARIGSDVPFCICGGTQLAEGCGEKLTVLNPAPECFVAVCKPDFPISTPALFARVDGVMLSHRPDTDAMLSAIARGDCGALCANVQNVFEQALPDAQRERIEEIKRALVENGAACAAMTGSGSAVFGLFSDEVLCRNACEVLQGDRVEAFFAEFV